MAMISSMSELDKIVVPRVEHHPRSLMIIDREAEESAHGKLEFDGWWWDEKRDCLNLTVQFLWNYRGIGVRPLQDWANHRAGRTFSFDLTDATFEGFSRPVEETVRITTFMYVIVLYLPMPLSG